MSVNIAAAIDTEIANLEAKLSALRVARRALTAGGNEPQRRNKGRRKYRKLTTAEKALISRRMKEAWKRRKASELP